MNRMTLAMLLCGVVAISMLAGCDGASDRSDFSPASGTSSAASSVEVERENLESSGADSTETEESSSLSAASFVSGSLGKKSDGKNLAVKAVENTGQFEGEELSILVSAGWMDNRYDKTIRRFEDTYGVTVDIQTIPADQYEDILQSCLVNGTCPDIFWIQSNPVGAIESNIGNPEEYCIDFTGAEWQDVMPEARQASCISGGKLYGL